MAKKVTIFLAVAAIALAVAWYWYNKPRQGVDNMPADVQIGAAELYSAYNSNEQAADKKYLNSIIEIKGVVDEVQVNTGDAVVIVSMQPGGGGISCRFSQAAKPHITKLKKGTEVRIKGRCAGFNMDVNLTDCEIVQ